MAAGCMYMDESIRKDFVAFACPVIPPVRANAIQRLVGGLLLKGQRELHMKAESEGRRRTILQAFAASGIEAVVVTSTQRLPQGRASCVAVAAEEAVARGCDRIVLDYIEENQNRRDRQIIRGVVTKLQSDTAYFHAHSWEYPGLQVADAVVWAWSAGGSWRRLIEPVVSVVREI